jgi:hypothetical protein
MTDRQRENPLSRQLLGREPAQFVATHIQAHPLQALRVQANINLLLPILQAHDVASVLHRDLPDAIRPPPPDPLGQVLIHPVLVPQGPAPDRGWRAPAEPTTADTPRSGDGR